MAEVLQIPIMRTIRCWTVQSIFVSHFLSTVFFLFAFYLHLHTFIVKCELKTIAPATFVTPFFSISNFFVFKFNRLSSLVHLLRAHRAKMCDVLHLRKTSFCCCLLCIVLRQWPRQVFKFHMVSCSFIVMDMILLLSLRFFRVWFCTWTVFFSFIHEICT